MAYAVYKYEIPLPKNTYGNFEIEMSPPIMINHVGLQNDKAYIWAQVDVDQPSKLFKFKKIGSGQEFQRSPGMNFIQTYMHDSFVWHIYFLGEKE